MITRIKMDDTGSSGIIAIVVIMASILVGATAASVVMDSTDGTSQEEDLAALAEQITDESIDELTTYIQINEKYGKYYGEPRQQKIKKIALEIKSLISKNIDLSFITIKINNGESIITLINSEINHNYESNTLFEHIIWDLLPDYTYGLIVTLDKDNSIINSNSISENTDRAYIVFNLPSGFEMSKGDSIIVSIIPSPGITRIIELKAPLPIKSVVIFE